MKTQNNQLERKMLMISCMGNLMIGVVGPIFAVMSTSQAIMLDGIFNLTYFVTGLFTLKVARLVKKGDSEKIKANRLETQFQVFAFSASFL